MIMEPSSVRDALAEPAYISQDPEDSIGRVEATCNKLLEVEPGFWLSESRGQRSAGRQDRTGKLQDAARKGIIDESQVDAINEYDAMRYDCLLTDAFDKDLKEVQVHAERPMITPQGHSGQHHCAPLLFPHHTF